MGIEFGIWDHFERRQGVPVKQQFRDRIEYVVEAERLGFYGYHVAEHHLTPLDLAPSQTIFLAMLAQETERIRLGTMVFCLPLYHPLRLIEEVAMLDNISNGRLMVGVGRGIRQREHWWFGLDDKEAQARYDETRDIIIDAFTKGRLDYKGQFFSFDDLPLDVMPVQKPYPEMWYGGSLEHAARNAMSVLGALGGGIKREQIDRFWELWEEGRRSGDPRLAWEREPKVGATWHTVIADSDEEALAIAERSWKQYWQNFTATPILVVDGSFSARAAAVNPGVGPELPPVVVHGSPDKVRKVLSQVVRESGPGFNFLSGAFQWGDITPDEAIRSIRLFASDVMPALREASGVHV